MKVILPADLAIDAEVDLGLTGDAYFLQARLNVSLPGLTARSLSRLSTPLTRLALIQRRRGAISTSRSLWRDVT